MLSYSKRCVSLSGSRQAAAGMACIVRQSRRSAGITSTCSAVADDKFAGYKPTIAALFPGQGAQSVGMAKEMAETVPAAKDLFDRASAILGYDLLQVSGIWRGILSIFTLVISITTMNSVT